MNIIPPITMICEYLSVDPSTLKNLGEERVVIKAQLLRLLLRMAASTLPFDGDWYCETNPDVRKAFEAGEIADLREDFLSTGFFEGRVGAPVVLNEAWYLAQFPDVRNAIASGRATSARDHYEMVGVAEWRAPPPEVIEDLHRWRSALIK